MENKADVRAIMARFQASGGSTDETSSTTPAGRIKQPLHPTLSSGPSMPAKKPVLESLSGSAINVAPKPNFLKNSVSAKHDTDTHEPNKTKALASRFGNTQDDASSKPFVPNKKEIPAKPPFSHASEAKTPGQKPPFNKPPLSSTLSDPKPAFPKPPGVVSKPSWVKEDGGGGGGGPGSTPSKIPPLQQKPSSAISKLRQQNEEMAEANTDSANKPSPPTNAAFKPPSNFRAAQNMFNKDMTEQSDGGVKADGVNKPQLTGTNSAAPPKPPASKKPSLKKPSKPAPQGSTVNGDAPSGPKRNPLPNSLALGPAPAKPNRPPKVNLEQFQRRAGASEDGPGTARKPITQTPLASQPSNHSNNALQIQPPPPALPSLPPRHPASMVQQEDFYDDVEEFSSHPPPLPPSTAHPSQRAKESDDDDGEMYEDLDDRWEAAEQKQGKMNDEKEKKRLDAERKEREKKEQDARKKFKLVGPLETIHQGKARVDCKGSKTDLALKQGDPLDIIRVQGNPEGKWLGRAQDGSIGYVKTTSVEIDFNTLKNRKSQQAYDPEVYDDIDVVPSDNSGMKGPGVVLPPLPGDGGEIYDDVVDPNLEVSLMDDKSSPTKPRGFLRIFDRNRRPASSKVVPPPSQFTADGNKDQPGAIDEEIYDDVDSQNLPPLPPLSSLPTMRGKEMDPKKQKKFEKEEKEFRKKFKYEGEIQVLYQVTVTPTLTNKKWSGKELPIKAGEKLDVIVKAVDNKLTCRNEEGKFGYVSTSYIVTDDGDIYDDIGDDCIYDND